MQDMLQFNCENIGFSTFCWKLNDFNNQASDRPFIKKKKKKKNRKAVTSKMANVRNQKASHLQQSLSIIEHSNSVI